MKPFSRNSWAKAPVSFWFTLQPVSDTHLDVYKRQQYYSGGEVQLLPEANRMEITWRPGDDVTSLDVYADGELLVRADDEDGDAAVRAGGYPQEACKIMLRCARDTIRRQYQMESVPAPMEITPVPASIPGDQLTDAQARQIAGALYKACLLYTSTYPHGRGPRMAHMAEKIACGHFGVNILPTRPPNGMIKAVREECPLKTLVELYDKEPLENVLTACIFKPEMVVYICDERDSSMRKETAVDRLFKSRGLPCKARFYYINTASPRNILRAFEAVLRDYPGCVFDCSGGKDLVLLGAGEFCKSRGIPMLYIDVARQKFVDLGGCESLAPQFAIPQFSAEDLSLIHICYDYADT